MARLLIIFVALNILFDVLAYSSHNDGHIGPYSKQFFFQKVY